MTHKLLAPDFSSPCEQCLRGANACAEHATGLEMKDIEKIFSAYFDSPYETEGAAVVRLKDKRYAVIWESSDCTGHG